MMQKKKMQCLDFNNFNDINEIEYYQDDVIRMS